MSANSVSKRIKIKAEDDAGVSNMDDIAGSAVTESESEDVGNNASIAVFTEDILPLIFDNLDILTANDLLHFRLVNRCWRDAATSVLLKRNLCEIQLNFGRVAFDEGGKAVDQDLLSEMSPEKAKRFSNILPTDKFFNVYQPSRFLADLNQLISTSPKFPSTSINFLACCSERFGNVSPIPADSEELDENQKDLLHFLNLYGREIKALAWCDTISKKAAHNLVYVHMPHLTCLDFRWFDEFLCADEDEGDDEAWEADQMHKVCLPPPSTLKVQKIILGYGSRLLKNDYNFVEDLFSVCPNLSSIQNVDMSSLGNLLKMGKFHLIKILRFDPRANQMPTFKDLFMYDLSRLHLSKLMVQLKESYGWRCGNKYDMVLKVLNLILSATKNSLECLELHLSPSNHQRHIFIPQLPHLRRLKLDCSNSSGTTRFHFLGDVIGKAIEAGKLGTDHTITDFLALALQNQRDGKIPADYFPRLRQVSLKVGKMESSPVQMMGFFPMEHLGPDPDVVNIVPGNTYSKVTTLVLDKCPRYDSNLSRSFPNVSHLTISCGSIIELQNWVWTAFPKLERFEIYEKNGADRDTNVVDSFFTGISPELCGSLESYTTSAELKADPAQIFERTMPYIGDCKNLKEFKIHFDEKLNLNLASKVTAIHGLSQVLHRTEITFSFWSVKWSVDEIQETRQYLEPIAAYVKIEI